QQIADKNMDLPPARGGFRRQAGRFDGDVERELQAHAASQHPAVEIARVAERVAIDPDEPEQAAGNRREQKALDCLAGEISRRARTASTDRGARRAPPNRSQDESPIAVVLSPSSPFRLSSFQPAGINWPRRLLLPCP